MHLVEHQDATARRLAQPELGRTPLRAGIVFREPQAAQKRAGASRPVCNGGSQPAPVTHGRDKVGGGRGVVVDARAVDDETHRGLRRAGANRP